MLSLLLLALGCFGSSSEAPRPAPAPVAPAAPSAPPDPLAGLSASQICADSVLLTIRYPWADLADGGFHRICCETGAVSGDDAWQCELDWPFSDVPTCDIWDGWRNGVFARYGYPFTDPRWKAEFEGQPWYRRRDDFDPAWLTPAAKGNVEVFKKWKAESHMCAG